MKIYTGARKFPVVVGKFPNGKNRARIPGGPYTLQQILVFAVIMVLTAILIINNVGNPIWVLIAGGAAAAASLSMMKLIPFDGVPVSSRAVRYIRTLTTSPLADTHPPARVRESVVFDTLTDLTDGAIKNRAPRA